MMSSKYRKGYLSERKVVKYLEERGWYVIRSAKSRGLFDILAVRKIDDEVVVIGVQVKSSYKLVYRDIAYKGVNHKMMDAYKKYGIIPLYATTDKEIRFYNVNGLELKLGKRNPNTNYSTNNSK